MAVFTQTITATVRCRGLIATTDDYNAYFNTTLAGGDLTQAREALRAASDEIRSLTGREFVEEEYSYSEIEIFDGRDRASYYPRQGPVLSVTTIEYWNGTAWTSIDTGVLTATTNGNKVYFREGGIFGVGVENWRITYVFGFRSFPEDLKRAAIALARNMIDNQRGSNISAQSDGEQSFSYFNTSKRPADVTATIGRYMRYSG